jgi:phosphoglycerate dehydrogenase-like enzyme
MQKFHKIAVLGDTRLLEDTKQHIQELSEQPVIFPGTNAADEDELVARTGDADAILFSWGTNITASYLEHCPSLKYIGVCATTLGNIDTDAVNARGIALKNVTDYGDEATAEWIFTQLLMLARGEGTYQWKELPSELFGKTIGIIGLGAVGQQVARLALGFGMNVLYFSRSRKSEWEAKGLIFTPLQELLSTSDVISLHTPRDVQMLGTEEFRLIPKGSILVETSVGNVLDEAAFKEWIGRQENYVIMDYSTGEKYYQLFHDLPRVTFPKVIAGMTTESKQRLGDKVVANIRQYLG